MNVTPSGKVARRGLTPAVRTFAEGGLSANLAAEAQVVTSEILDEANTPNAVQRMANLPE